MRAIAIFVAALCVDGLPDECEPDCNSNGITDACEIAAGSSTDCNSNGIHDECDPIGGGDYDANGIIDLGDHEFFVDCLAGPNVPPTPTDAECINLCLEAFDDDTDGDVDLADSAAFTRRFSP